MVITIIGAKKRKGELFTFENVGIIMIAILAMFFVLKAGMAYQERLYTPAKCINTSIDPPKTYDIDSCWVEGGKNYTCTINRKIRECAGGCTHDEGCDCFESGISYPIGTCKRVGATNYSCEMGRRKELPEFITCPSDCIDGEGCTSEII